MLFIFKAVSEYYQTLITPALAKSATSLPICTPRGTEVRQGRPQVRTGIMTAGSEAGRQLLSPVTFPSD